MSLLTKDHRLIEDTQLISPPTERQLLDEEVTETRLPFMLRQKAEPVISEINTALRDHGLSVCFSLTLTTAPSQHTRTETAS